MTAFVIESWTWYGVVLFMLVLRYTARLLHFKDIRKLQLEDWLMLFVFCIYTILIAFLNICVNASTNLIDPADIPNLTEQEIKDRTWGSKCVLVVESCMCATQWGTKACLLLLYWRLTQNLRQGLVVKAAAAFVATTFIVMMSLYYGYWCRPFTDFWKTPTSNIQCATQTHHLIVNLVFNLTTDILIMSIPLPLMIRAHLEVKRKILLVFPFSLGFFTIICAILSKNLSFNHPFSAEWVYWYCREASTAMIVSNMPYSWAIIRRVFNLKSFFGESVNSGGDMAGEATRMEGISVGQDSRRGTISSTGSKRPFALGSLSFPGRNKPKLMRFKSHNSDNNLQEPDDNNQEYQKIPDVDTNSPVSSTSKESAFDRAVYSRSQDKTDVDRLYCLDDDVLERQAAIRNSPSYAHDLR